MSPDPITRAFDSLAALPPFEGDFLRQLLFQAIDDPALATDVALSEHLQLVPQVLRALPLEPQFVRRLQGDNVEWARTALGSIAATVAAGNTAVSRETLTKLSQLPLRDVRFLANFLDNRGVSHFIDEQFLASLQPQQSPATIDGTDIQAVPTMHQDRVLELGRNGWQLCEFRSEGARIYIGWQCGEYDGLYHYLFVRSEQRPIAQFLAGRLTTRDLLGVSSDDAGFLLSFKSSAPVRARLVVVSGLPPGLLPHANERHNPDLRPPSDQVTQSFLVEGAWSAELFRELEKDYQTAFALTYFLDPSSGSAQPNAMHALLLDGYNYGKLYAHLRKALPENESARATAVAAASPGVLSITAGKLTAEKLASVLRALESKETAQAYRAMHDWSRLDEREDVDRVPPRALEDLSRLAEMLSVSIERLLRGGDVGQVALLRAGKILASYYRYLHRLAAPGEGIEFLPPHVSRLPSALKLPTEHSPVDDEEDALFDDDDVFDDEPDERDERDDDEPGD